MTYPSMDEEYDRYKRLLEDWDEARATGPAPKPAPKKVEPEEPITPRRKEDSARPRAKMGRRPAPEVVQGRYPKGTILCLDDEELVIYRRPISGNDSDMVYSLLADGSAKIEGLELDEYSIEELGLLTATDLKTLQSTMRWNRDLIAPNCKNQEDVDRIPDPGESDEETAAPDAPEENAEARDEGENSKPSDHEVEDLVASEAASKVVEEAPQGKTRIRRGQRLTLKFGDRNWEAVYWGKDKKGSVVAHMTHGHWTLMHLDLNRFKETMIVDTEPDSSLTERIGEDLSAKSSR